MSTLETFINILLKKQIGYTEKVTSYLQNKFDEFKKQQELPKPESANGDTDSRQDKTSSPKPEQLEKNSKDKTGSRSSGGARPKTTKESRDPKKEIKNLIHTKNDASEIDKINSIISQEQLNLLLRFIDPNNNDCVREINFRKVIFNKISIDQYVKLLEMLHKVLNGTFDEKQLSKHECNIISAPTVKVFDRFILNGKVNIVHYLIAMHHSDPSSKAVIQNREKYFQNTLQSGQEASINKCIARAEAKSSNNNSDISINAEYACGSKKLKQKTADIITSWFDKKKILCGKY